MKSKKFPLVMSSLIAVSWTMWLVLGLINKEYNTHLFLFIVKAVLTPLSLLKLFLEARDCLNRKTE